MITAKKIIKAFIPYGIVFLYKKIVSKRSSLEGIDSNTEHARWVSCDGDNTYRLDYPDLTSKDIVFDVGGYRGEWSKKIYAKYSCNIFIFEPVPLFFEHINKYFAKNSRVRVCDYALGDRTGEATISLADDGSSLDNSVSSSCVNIKVLRVSEFIYKNNIDEIGLMKINVEGSEFDIVNNLYVEGLLAKVKNLQIQFHPFVENYQRRLEKSREQLSYTHTQTWNFEGIWENWTLKSEVAISKDAGSCANPRCCGTHK